MHSTLLEFGPFTLKAFGLLMALGFASAWYAAVRLSRGTHRNSDYISNLVVWLMVSGVIGARLAYVVEHWKLEFAGKLAAIPRLDMGGLMFYGGLAGATLALCLFVRWHREPFLAVSDLLLAVLPLGHFFGRIGCFLNGCCHGHITHSWLAVTFPKESPAWHQQVENRDIPPAAAQSDPVLPTQLIEAAANLILFLLLYRLYRRHRDRHGLVTGTYLMTYAVIRFLVEPLRGDVRLQVAGVWSIGQFISILLYVAGACILVWCRRSDRGQTADPNLKNPRKT